MDIYNFSKQKLHSSSTKHIKKPEGTAFVFLFVSAFFIININWLEFLFSPVHPFLDSISILFHSLSWICFYCSFIINLSTLTLFILEWLMQPVIWQSISGRDKTSIGMREGRQSGRRKVWIVSSTEEKRITHFQRWNGGR